MRVGMCEGGVNMTVAFVTCSTAYRAPLFVLLQAKLPSHLKRLPMTLNCMTARANRRRWRGRKRGREKRRKTTLPWTHSTPPVKRGRGSITHPLLCRTIQLWSTWHNSHRHHVHSHSSPQHFLLLSDLSTVEKQHFCRVFAARAL